MELENTQNNALAKLPMLKLGSMRCGRSRSNSIFRSRIMLYGRSIFGGNKATKKTHKALLKIQYDNFSASSHNPLVQIFNRLQRLVSRLAILGVVTPPEDLNVKFLRSLPSEWDTHVVVWMNKPDFDTMGLDDLELEEKSSSMEATLLDMTNQSSTKAVKIKDASEKAMCAIDGSGFDWSDMAEEEILENMALMAFSESERLRTVVNKSDHRQAAKRDLAIIKKNSKEPEVNEYGLRNSSLKPTIGCDKESKNSKENTGDSLKQHQKTDTETSSVKSSLKVDKDWKEKFFHPANHVREVEPKKVRENNELHIEDSV
ncbi:hypothetical protein Tco_0952548 [Tanacetum coccineum]|uniref:Uncharacterized protein n=1 Tax=Tanacetum coccineum TaxID=301880 RepID=A0ABQ5DZ64_9ASTR